MLTRTRAAAARRPRGGEQDTVRTGTYRSAIVQNPADFAGKVVLDVGTGTGILAVFAVQAGARRVYAVEASNMAALAERLVAANGLSDRITVIRGKVEEVELPEPVDVIVSEPMGFLLVHERMLESYMVARQRFLRPGGLMFPTTGTIFACPFTDQALYDEQLAKSSFWDSPDFYGLNLAPLKEEALQHHMAQVRGPAGARARVAGVRALALGPWRLPRRAASPRAAVAARRGVLPAGVAHFLHLRHARDRLRRPRAGVAAPHRDPPALPHLAPRSVSGAVPSVPTLTLPRL